MANKNRRGRKKKETNTPTHIFENFYMDADSKQYILVEKVIRTNQETNEQYDGIITHGYYTSIENLLNAIINISTRKKIMLNKLPILKDTINELKTTKIKLENICFNNS